MTGGTNRLNRPHHRYRSATHLSALGVAVSHGFIHYRVARGSLAAPPCGANHPSRACTARARMKSGTPPPPSRRTGALRASGKIGRSSRGAAAAGHGPSLAVADSPDVLLIFPHGRRVVVRDLLQRADVPAGPEFTRPNDPGVGSAAMVDQPRGVVEVYTKFITDLQAVDDCLAARGDALVCSYCAWRGQTPSRTPWRSDCKGTLRFGQTKVVSRSTSTWVLSIRANAYRTLSLGDPCQKELLFRLRFPRCSARLW